MVDAMDGDLPDWVRQYQPACRIGLVCALGSAAGASSKGEAFEVARGGATAELVSRIVVQLSGTTDIEHAQGYVGSQRSESGSVRQKIETQVRGKLRETQVLKRYWTKRVKHGRHGTTHVYDAWVVVGVPKVVLDAAFSEELERSRVVCEQVNSTAARHLAALRGPEPTNPTNAFVDYARSTIELADLIDGGVKAKVRVRELEAALSADLEVKHTDALGQGDALIVSFRGVPVVGLQLHAKSQCIVAENTTGTTDANGVLRLSLKRTSRFAPCDIVVATNGLPSISQNIVVPSQLSELVFMMEVRVSGFGSRSIGARLHRLEGELSSAHAVLRSKRERRGRAPRESDPMLILVVTASAQPPARLGGRLLRAHGSATTTLLLRDGSTTTLKEEHAPVVGIGASTSLVATNLAEKIAKVAADILDAGMKEL